MNKNNPLNIKLDTYHWNKVGDRGLTTAQKNKIKKDAGYKCCKCKEKKHPAELDIDHKKAIHKHKNQNLLNIEIPFLTINQKHKPSYDKKKNLQVICKICHQKKNKQEAKTRAKKRAFNPLDFI